MVGLREPRRGAGDLFTAAGVRSYYVAPMQTRHIPAVSAIERESFPVPWPASAYRREIERNQVACYLVARRSPLAGTPRREPRFPLDHAQPTGTDGSLLGRIGRLFRADGRVYDREVADELESIVGYAGMWLMVDEAHVTTIAVEPSYRGEGVGELLLLALLDRAYELGADTATLECRVSNAVAQQLYRKYTFADAGIRKHYYSDDGEDALIMTTQALDSPGLRQAVAFNRQRLLGRLRAAE